MNADVKGGVKGNSLRTKQAKSSTRRGFRWRENLITSPKVAQSFTPHGVVAGSKIRNRRFYWQTVIVLGLGKKGKMNKRKNKRDAPIKIWG